MMEGLQDYKREFTDFMLSCGALKFGDFTLKSGRKSPFFMNAGAYVTGGSLMKLGEYYAKAAEDMYGDSYDVIFGPAYKGIPLSVVTAEAVSRIFGREVRYCSNRKEIKDHGDTGILLGSKLKDGDRVLIVEDVTTSGKSMEETVPILRAQAKVEITGLVVSLDRCEKGIDTDEAALTQISKKYGFRTGAIVTMKEVTEILKEDGRLTDDMVSALERYYAEYGALS
ncbi:MAG: orotate phosphoribosyltransferase [Lachnospiraceae bacterium]|nr:orotate phosphoribosyltransferase [Lachnospiraceae bacterium]